MHVRFASMDDSFIKAEVKSGCYTNETELVRDAVRRLREEKERNERFRHAVAKGLDAIDRGETRPLTPELLEQIKREGIRRSENNEPYSNTDALPENI